MSPVTPAPPTATGPRPRSARGQGEHLRGELIEAALALLAQAGDPEDVSIRAVAKAAGVSPTAAYRHFEDRDALIQAACEHCFDLFAALLLQAIEGVDDPFDALRRSGEAYLRFALEDQGLYRAMFSNPLHIAKDYSDEESAGRTAFVVLVDMVQACLDAGAPASGPGGVGEPDATYLAIQVWTWLHGMVDLHITHPAMPWPDMTLLVDDVARTLGLHAPG